MNMRDSGFPKLVLENGKIRVSIHLPDPVHGYYRGTRFDWAGIIEHVDTAKHRFYAPLHAAHDPYRHDCVSGPAEEFGMFRPMGYAEAEPGESFVKIGVGLLRRRDDTDYLFSNDYEVIHFGDWSVEQGSDRVVFFQDFVGERGWAYRYTKTISLVPGEAELVIAHRLENSGTKTIDLLNYNHNFTVIDDQAYGPDYRVEFPFTTAIPIGINNRAWFRDNAVEVPEPLGDGSLWIPLYEGQGRADYNRARITHLPSGASVEFTGDAPVTRMVFWAIERAACPEPFIRLKLAPGQSKEWSSHYRYSDGACIA
ncbi:MAG: hypothetical protein QNJ11_03455 [Woeseiaceae bacterium]|nr:hypothetical protein [Woeseiaceae bacterium]